MERVTGIGGIFFKANDPEALKRWYEEHLGVENAGGVTFKWREQRAPEREGYTVWAPFKKDTKYFAPSESSFMINYRVDDLHKMLAQLRAAGVKVEEKIDESEYGRFGWVIDPEGNKIELWEPPREK